MYSLGIDIGYASIKLVIINEKNEIKETRYILHKGDMGTVLLKALEEVGELYGKDNISHIGLTGEGAKRFEKLNKDLWFNEVYCLVEGSLGINENIGSIIEIGAQSAKYIYDVSNRDKSRIGFAMNSSCSAGTGSFLEEQVSRLGLKLEDYSEYIKKATSIPRIAGRCSVFAKTDIIHHQQEGIKTEDMLLGLAYALVRNYKGSVIKKTPIKKPIIFAGGVGHNEGIIQALKDILDLEEGDLIIPKEFPVFGALGAAINVKEKGPTVTLDELIKFLVKEGENPSFRKMGNDFNQKPLHLRGKREILNKHRCKTIGKDEKVDAYLGIDIGSTSTNLVLMDEENEIITYRYLRTLGDSLNAVQKGLGSIYEEFGDRVTIKGMGTTGSGRYLVGKKAGSDVIVNEITAQAKAAITIDPEVDTIFEIGGQDSKYIQIEKGVVVDFEMNKICAAGTGSFIEEQAKKLDIAIEDYGDLALKSDNPIYLGERCTVFIEGNIANALAEGAKKEDIASGLSYSIVNNYLNRVVGTKKVGKKIFFQGGVTNNQAVVNAFESVLGKEIKVPPFFSVTGAYGVAILTKEKMKGQSTNFKGWYLDQNVKDESLEVSPKEKHSWIEEKMEKLFLKGYTGKIDPSKKTIGIPRVLFLHKLFTMFNVFFKELGFNVILSDQTNSHIVGLIQVYSLDETCYPIKLINGHVASLLDKGVDYIFLPSLYTMKHANSKTREDYSCTFMQTIPQMVNSVMDLENKGIELLAPALSFKFGKKYMAKTLMDMGAQLGKGKIKTISALQKGMGRLMEYENEVEKLGKDIIDNLKPDEKAFVIITRTYNIVDKGLNMGIPQKLREMGYKVLNLSNLPAHDHDISKEYPNMYWPFGQHIISGTQIVKQNPNLYAIYLSNHGCGPDSMIAHYVKDEMKGKPYLHIEVDEHESSVGVITRLEAFVNSIDGITSSGEEILPIEKYSKVVKHKNVNIGSNSQGVGKLYIPYLFPYGCIYKEIFKNKRIDAEVLPMTNEASLKIGKSYSMSKEYLSCLGLIGDVMSNIDEIRSNKGSIYIPKTEGSEVFGQYNRLLRQKLDEANYEDVKIVSPFMEDMLIDETHYGIDMGLGTIAGDLVMTSHIEVRQEYLDKVCDLIKRGKLNEQNLKEMAKDIYEDLKKRNYLKRVLALGEVNILFQPFLNEYRLKKIEEEHIKIIYQPLGELLWMRWNDYFIKEKKKNKSMKKHLYELQNIMGELHHILCEHSPYDKDLGEFVNGADSKLKLYAGGDGRYRFTKLYRHPENINGIMTIGSMYENTATILNILQKNFENEEIPPIINLDFDGTKHNTMETKINTFIHYI
ncbi:acyl-CoA dehydratase activase [Anaeromicrobium sediminis]|uniref:CoA activase n=1 Tax=Anaeromicrobium sediminis TaxID=1478221 RepID=A0A267MHH4_9FIRM|nr:acyl-CoA dehydratase activase [Anaeromicrobium sediminis]PAB58378.1 CoA activase [Anaeromicrobium sediminis]